MAGAQGEHEHREFSEGRGTPDQTNWTPFPSVPTGLLVLREAGSAPEVMTSESERTSTLGCALQADFKMQNSPWCEQKLLRTRSLVYTDSIFLSL